MSIFQYDSVKAFDLFSKDYLKIRESEFNNLTQLAFLENKLNPLQKKRILELGCGGGVPILKYFYDKSAEAWGIDFSGEMIKVAKKNLPEATFIHEDMVKSNLPTSYFDAIISFYSIFVLELNDQFKVFEKIFNALKVGGITYFSLLSEAATKQKEFNGLLPFLGHQFFYAHTTPDKYKNKLENIGFNNINLEERSIGPETCLWIYAEKNT